MAPFGFGRKAPEQEAPTTAIERAAAGEHEQGLLGGPSTRLLQGLLEIGIDGRGPVKSAEQVAEAALRQTGTPEKAVDLIVNKHLRLAGASGFVTSLGGFITLPVGLPANVFGFYVIATRMVASVAAVRGYDVRDERIRSAVLLTLVGADADELLRKAGMVSATGGLTGLAAERLPGPALMVLNKAVAFRLLSTVGRQSFTRLGRALPLAGGVIGGTLDTWLLTRIAGNARQEFPQAEHRVGPPGGESFAVAGSLDAATGATGGPSPVS
ncbi:MAG TPA: EcsC family protein [Dermatophilaceae bacterium]|nr:EcsC family protein [Dermatophilaceae bacterium]